MIIYMLYSTFNFSTGHTTANRKPTAKMELQIGAAISSAGTISTLIYVAHIRNFKCWSFERANFLENRPGIGGGDSVTDSNLYIIFKHTVWSVPDPLYWCSRTFLHRRNLAAKLVKFGLSKRYKTQRRKIPKLWISMIVSYSTQSHSTSTKS
jgi:hypothetical protein